METRVCRSMLRDSNRATVEAAVEAEAPVVKFKTRICEVCGDKFKTHIKFQNHCGEKFKTHTKFQKHFREREQLKRFRCLDSLKGKKKDAFRAKIVPK